jgi:flagellar basal body rod protein FlgB
MLRGLIGEGSVTSILKAGLGQSTRRLEGIYQRIANAATPGYEDVPGYTPDGEPGRPGPVDLETEMVALADEHLRFDAGARLLRMNYDMIRSTMRQG